MELKDYDAIVVAAKMLDYKTSYYFTTTHTQLQLIGKTYFALKYSLKDKEYIVQSSRTGLGGTFKTLKEAEEHILKLL